MHKSRNKLIEIFFSSNVYAKLIVKINLMFSNLLNSIIYALIHIIMFKIFCYKYKNIYYGIKTKSR